MRFTLTYTEGNGVGRPKPPEGFKTIQEAKEWCDQNNLSYYLLSITESNEDDFIASCNFDEPAEENWEDLSGVISY